MVTSTNTVKAVIFDYDGTLLDSMPAWHTLENDLAWMVGAKLSQEEKDSLNACTLSQLVAYFHRTYGVGRNYEVLLQEAHNQLLTYYSTLAQPRKGVAGFLKRLHEDGVAIAVATASPRSFLEVGLKRFDLLKYFDILASADEENTSKQNPSFLKRVAQRLGFAPNDIWGFDDSTYALEVMGELGFSTIGIYDSDTAGSFPRLQATANYAIHEFSDLDYETFITNQYV